MFKLAWWKDESNVKGANAIVGFLKVVVPLIVVSGVTVAGWFGYQGQQSQSSSTPTPQAAPAPAPASVTTITADNGGAVQTGSGTQVVTGNNSNVTIGFSEQAFFAQLTAREAQLRDDLTRASDAERALLEQQLNAVSTQKEDIDSAYEKAVDELETLRVKLARFDGQVASDKITAAQSAVVSGDRTLADEVLTQVASSAGADAAVAAEAAFTRGQIAEQEFRWQDAAAQYARAADLDPSFEYLRKAHELAWMVADHGTMVSAGKQMLAVARDSGNVEDTAEALNAYGLGLQLSGDVADSKAIFEEGLTLAKENLGEAHYLYPSFLNNLARAHQDTGLLVKAEALYREILERDKTATDIDQSEYADGLQNLAELLDEMGRWEESKPLFREAFELRKAELGEAHPDYAESLSAMAWVLADEDKLQEAVTFHKRAISLAETALGAEHPSTKAYRADYDAFLEDYPEAADQD